MVNSQTTTILTTHSPLSLTFIATGLGVSLLTGCEAVKKAEKKAPPPPVLSDYVAKKDGEWMNAGNIFRFKENPSVTLKRYKNWIGRSYFNLISQKNRASFALPSSKIIVGYEEMIGENPSIVYACSQKKFALFKGSRANAILGSNENNSYQIYRIDGKTQWGTKAWQISPHKNEGINLLKASVAGAPPQGVATSNGKKPFSIDDYDKKDPLSKILEAKTFEMSIIPDKDDGTRGIYARWDFSPTLKELKASGDLDRACEMMLGKDHITIQTAKTTKTQPAKKDNNNKDDKQ